MGWYSLHARFRTSAVDISRAEVKTYVYFLPNLQVIMTLFSCINKLPFNAYAIWLFVSLRENGVHGENFGDKAEIFHFIKACVS